MGSFFAWTSDQTAGVIDQVVGAAIGGLYNIDTTIFSALDSVLSGLWGILQDVWHWLGGIWQALKNFILNSIHWVMHTLLPDLVRWINEIRAKITAWLQPLIKYLKLEKQMLDGFYNNVLRPILNLIQRLRSILMIFRLLHIQWATTLDQYLADLESKITGKFLELVEGLQMVSNWINWLTDPTGLFNIPLLLLSNLQTLPQLWAALWDQQSTPIGAQDAANQTAMAQSGVYSNAKSDITSRGSTPTTDDLTRYTAVSQLYVADGYTKG